MRIRRMADRDADAVCVLIARNLREVNSKDYPADYVEAIIRAHDHDTIVRRMHETHMYVACEADAVIGCGVIRYDESKDESLLLTIFVLPEFHGQGVGRQIVRALEADTYARRSRRIVLHASVTAEAFYRKLGYTYEGGMRTLGADGCIRLEKRHEQR